VNVRLTAGGDWQRQLRQDRRPEMLFNALNFYSQKILYSILKGTSPKVAPLLAPHDNLFIHKFLVVGPIPM